MDPVIVADGRGQALRHTTALAGATGRPSAAGVTGLLGANGAGKTTLLGLVLGLHRPDAGSLARARPRPRPRPAPRSAPGSATPPSTTPCPGDMPAHDLVRHLAEVHGLPRGGDRPGQRRAVAGRPGRGAVPADRHHVDRPAPAGQAGRRPSPTTRALVLLDEPTDGLDPVQREEMLALIRRIGTEFGIDVVLSSHLLEEVERVCDPAVILAGGRGGARPARSTSCAAPATARSSRSTTGPTRSSPASRPGRRQSRCAGTARRLDVTSAGRCRGGALRRRAATRSADSQGVAAAPCCPRRPTLEDVFLRFGSAPRPARSSHG